MASVGENRVTSFSQHQKMMGIISRTQSRLAQTQIQISSGQVSQDYAGLSGKVEYLSALESKMKGAKQYMESNAVVTSRLRTMSVAVDGVLEIAGDARKLITTARSVYITEKGVLMPQAKALLKNISEQLNTSLGGRFLFGGSKTDSPPVAEEIPDNVVSGVPDNGYYSGDSHKISTRISEAFNMEYGVTADEAGFQKLITAINKAYHAIDAQNPTGLGSAMDLVTEAIDGINSIKSRIGNNIVNVNNANAVHSKLEIYWKGLAGEVTDTDIVSATTQVQFDSAILQASFQAFAKVSNLKLTDYLR